MSVFTSQYIGADSKNPDGAPHTFPAAEGYSEGSRRLFYRNASWASLIFFSAVSMFCIYLSKQQYPTVLFLEKQSTRMTTAIIEMANWPGSYVHQTSNILRSHQDLRSEINMLQTENQYLKQLQHHAMSHIYENIQLKQLLNVLDQDIYHQLTVPVVGLVSDGLRQSIFIAGSSEQGIVKGQTVITPYGILGRIASVDRKRARVLPLTDMSFRLPVQSQRTGEHGILVGHNTQTLTLSHTSSSADFKVGDWLVTSGRGNLFPKGFAAAEITKVQKNSVQARPLATLHGWDFVLVLRS